MSFDDDTPTILPGSVAPISEQDASTRLSTPVPTSFTSSVTTDGVNSPPPSLAPGETGPLVDLQALFASGNLPEPNQLTACVIGGGGVAGGLTRRIGVLADLMNNLVGRARLRFVRSHLDAAQLIALAR